MAMEDTLYIRDFPIETSISSGFPLATFLPEGIPFDENYRRTKTKSENHTKTIGKIGKS